MGLVPHGGGNCTVPDFQVRIAQEGCICKDIAATISASLSLLLA